jgi:hypothetical protein
MTMPEDALERAREQAAAMRAGGAYTESPPALLPQPSDSITTQKLYEWALIEPDLREVRSTRRFGAPMTAFKRGLLRLLQQYHASLIAEQTRFNVNLLVHVKRLEERIEALERATDGDEVQLERGAGGEDAHPHGGGGP